MQPHPDAPSPDHAEFAMEMMRRVLEDAGLMPFPEMGAGPGGTGKPTILGSDGLAPMLHSVKQMDR